MKAIKLLLLSLLLTQIAEAQGQECSKKDKAKAIKLWRESRFIKDYDKKIAKLQEAARYCQLSRIVIDGNLAYYMSLPKDKLEEEKLNLKQLQQKNSNLDVEIKGDLSYIDNNTCMIEKLLGSNQTECQKRMKGTSRALTEINGVYRADIRFEYNSSAIKETQMPLIKEITQVIVQEVKKNPNALFNFEGGASSEGRAEYNRGLSLRRAEALRDYIINRYSNLSRNIEVIPKGENELICEGGFLPEINPKGEAQCITKEDKEASRRVTIRRVQ